MSKEKDIHDGDKILNDMIDGSSFEEVEQDFYDLESYVLSNPFILKHATKEEMAGYKLIDELPKKDIKQTLINMVNELEVDKEEEEVIMSMDRNLLKLLMLNRWLLRMKKSTRKKD